MFGSVLIVCTGNICRSPMAEALLRAHAGDRLRVESAGVGALQDREADPVAVALMAERGLDLGGHQARQIDLELAQQFDLLLAMEQEQVDWLNAQFPVVRGRVHRLGRWREADIPDPYRGTREDFEHALAEIEACLGDWQAKGLLPAEAG
ncbi:hypothetical protein AN478_10595 [Thiohalorhabdus denitrificans]|uniref:protein-tyrosine-phosphatase n=1 Tax=Thiohalorhabdus denitrificans TaxID=381306 RepID=A0A0P9C474_9GAMM|nr:low molecular weight protein-tyrosine-phosphatase [Thiohalorhabdus denitrificans]KPV39580.1 hypothetical protein AN478_10595 [Thiohalorhabdus denitrificans]SCX97909.1 protein-tyrosine phosphatase [Thiohalorhabdus denitrificans]